MNVKTAIETGDREALERLLAEDPARVNELIQWGQNDRLETHPLHYVCDMLFAGTLEKGRELGVIDALIKAGADLDFQKNGKGDTPLIGAASLNAEDVGIALLDAGAKTDPRGLFGETALHWAAMLGEDRLVATLIETAELNLPDDKYKSTPLGWAIHGMSDPPKGNRGNQREVIKLLVAAGAKVEEKMQAAVAYCTQL